MISIGECCAVCSDELFRSDEDFGDHGNSTGMCPECGKMLCKACEPMHSCWDEDEEDAEMKATGLR